MFGGGTPNQGKLAYLAGVNAAIYANTVAAAAGPAASNVRKLSSPPQLIAWAWELEGETLIAIEGTTSADQYALETDGYINPSFFTPGGYINSYFAMLADGLFPTLPNAAAVISGHSLGGAVAVHLAYRLKAAGLPVKGAVTFGSPRVYTPAGAAAQVFPPIRNITQLYDPVPLLATDGVGGDNWRTPGEFYLLHPGGFLELFTQGVSFIGDVYSLIQNYGFGSHASTSYADTLVVPAVVPFSNPLLGDPSVLNIYQVQVKGEVFSQACDNVIHYLWAGVDPPPVDQLNVDFRTVWRQYVLPRVSPQYAVDFYETRRISSIVQLLNTKVVPPAPYVPPRGNYRYDSFVRFTGLATDIGSNSNADCFPSFNAVGASKACDGWRDPNTGLIIGGTKQPRGDIGFGGIPRNSTQATTAGNKLTTTEKTSWDAVVENLRHIHTGGRDWLMVVLTHTGPGGGQLFNTANPPEPIFYYALVTSLGVNPYITSRVSRKQTVSGRG